MNNTYTPKIEEEETEPTFTDYEMKKVQNTEHEHSFVRIGKDLQGWDIYKCPCGAGYGEKKNE